VRAGEAAARYDARQLTEYSHRHGIIFRFNTTVGRWRGSDSILVPHLPYYERSILMTELS
jgi:hypothetical protein